MPGQDEHQTNDTICEDRLQGPGQPGGVLIRLQDVRSSHPGRSRRTLTNWTISSLMLVVVAISGVVAEGWLTRGPAQARATILENHRKGRGGHLVVAFTGPSGEYVRANAEVYGWPSATDPGKTVTVRYFPADPAGTVTLKPSIPDVSALVLVCAGAVVNVLITCCLWFAWLVRRLRQDTAVPWT